MDYVENAVPYRANWASSVRDRPMAHLWVKQPLHLLLWALHETHVENAVPD